MMKSSTKIKIFSIGTLWVFTALSVIALFSALKIPTNYNFEQFLPRKHPLLAADQESKKVFQISSSTPYIVVLTLNKSETGTWSDRLHLRRLTSLSEKIQSLASVKSVVSLGNIPSAFEHKNQLMVGSLGDLQKQGYPLKGVQKDPLYSPHLISKDGRHAALFVTAKDLSIQEHRKLIAQLELTSRRMISKASVQVGGPGAIRTQLISLLSHEILLFILLALLASMGVLKIMFRGYGVLPQVGFILLVTNTLALGVMSALGFSFNVLSSTLPILVTITSLGIATHTLVRMGDGVTLPWSDRVQFLKHLMVELSRPHLLTTACAAVGFATLISSSVPIISDFGKVVSMSVLIAGLVTLVLVPCLYLWVKWPTPRPFVQNAEVFSYLLVRNARYIVPGIAAIVLIFMIIGTNLSWTAKLYDDLPPNQPARRSTDLISRKLGGVATVDFIVGHPNFDSPWKLPANIKSLKGIAESWRTQKQVGSVMTLADFLTTGADRKQTPKTRAAIAELQFLYSMSGESPLTQFVSADEKWTRLAVRLPDLPANKNREVLAKLKLQLKKQFPLMEVKVSGVGAIVPVVNDHLSTNLMWGFFEAMFWIVLLISINFRSLRWALIGVVPNLVPPVLLLGFLALFKVPIKPGIAIIFSICLGIAFVNTVYVLERLKTLLKGKTRRSTLPIYSLMKVETMPCLVSSLSLVAGFSIFLFSSFPVNKMFGVFMLISIFAGLLGDLVWLPAILKRFPWLLLESEGQMSKFPIQIQKAAKIGPYLILLGLGLVAFHSSYASGETIQQILKNVETNAAPPNERVRIKMIIQDANGAKQERVLTILRQNKGGSKALVRLLEPSDLKGLSLLSVSKDGKEDQWLYLPSDKKSRRILGSNKKGKFLGSEIAYEDLRVSTYRDFNNKVTKDDGKMIEVESVAKADSESSYGRIVTWISKPDYKIEKVDYYDKAGKLLKQAQFKAYKKIDNKFWRAGDVSVENVQDKRKTKLIVQRVSTKKISDDEISLSALEE